MIQMLSSLWAKYKLLTWRQKALRFLPLVIVAVGAILLFFIKRDPAPDLIADQIKYQKKVVDKQLNRIDKQEAKLKAQEKALSVKRDSLQKVIEENEKEVKTLSADIDRATSNGDIEQLRSIHRKLRNRAKSIKHK